MDTKKTNGNKVFRIYDGVKYVPAWIDEDFAKLLKKVQAARILKEIDEPSLSLLTTEIINIPQFEEVIKQLLNSPSPTIKSNKTHINSIFDKGSVYDE